MEEDILIAPRPLADSKYLYYKFKRETKWHTTHIKNDGTKKAEKLARAYAMEVWKNGPGKKDISFKEFSKDYFIYDKCPYIKARLAGNYTCTKAHAQNRRSHLEKYIWPYKAEGDNKTFGEKDVKDFSIKYCREFLTYLKTEKDLADETIHKVAHTAQIIFEDIKNAEKYRQNNPMKETKKGKIVKKKPREDLKIEDLQKLYPQNKEQLFKIWKTLFWLTLGIVYFTSGRRRNEILIRRWKHLNKAKGYIEVFTSLTADNIEGETKGKQRSSIKLPNIAIKVLEYWHQNTNYNKPDDFIFPGEDNGHIGPNSVTKMFKRIYKRAKLDIKNRNICLHSLRHTYVTLLAEENIPSWFSKQQVDHKSDEIHANYDHSNPSKKLEKQIEENSPLMEKIDNTWRDFDIKID